MLTALTGSTLAAQMPAAALSPPTPPAADPVSRATQPDTVTISAQAQQAYSASQDADHDGDSH